MEFRILGPLEVVSHERALDLGGQKQRALLLVLLLEANRVVSADRLIDAVWDGSPPPTAPKAVQVHVSQLRKLLGRERVQTRAPGYVLRVDADELDLERFERLWAEGRLRDALALWRGPPLPEFSFQEFAQREIARLQERRLLCLEERIDADLAAGRHGAVVPELEALVREEPLREGPRERLMLALYRSGRQAEALEAFQEGRRLLVDELGIEPGRPLRELQHAILEQDPSLDAAGTVDQAAGEGERTEVVPVPPADVPVAADVRKTITAMSVRVAAFPAGDEPLDPEALRRVVGRAFAEVEGAVERHRGTIESVTGDAVTAVFGLPVVHEDDALRGLRAADELSKRLEDVAAALAGHESLELEFRIGISTGRVVTGTSSGPQLRATGVPLMLSARLSEGAPPGEIVFDEDTWRLVRATAACERANGGWRLLGLGEPPPGAPARLASPMVGRDRERQRLRDALDQAVADESCQLFTVLGLAGVGKSRLVQEFLDDLGDRVLVARGRCLPYGDGITYWPLVEAVSEAAGIDDSDSREVGRAKLRDALEGEDGAAAVAERVARIVGLAEAETGGDEAFSAARAFFEALARRKPLVLVFDDIHWGETLFLDLVEHLAEWSRDVPILLVCMARPELLDARPSWGGGKLNATTRLLDRLSDADCGRLIENLVGEGGLAGEVAVKIADAAEGNPLFVEEMLLMLIEDGRLARTDGHWAAMGDLDAVRVPPTIEALLATRLDQLEATERGVIERAAVSGKVFWEGAIFELTPTDSRPKVEAALRALVRKELIRPERESLGSGSYSFRHLLILDAAYDAIPKQARADLHRRFGMWLERATGDRATEYEEVVGYHLEQAYLCLAELGPLDAAALALAREAARRLGSAGRRAFTLSDPAAGINLISRAVALLPADERLRVELVPNVRAVQAFTRDLAWAERVLTEAVEAAATSGDRPLAATALVQRGLLRLFTGAEVPPEELIETADRAIAVFEEVRDDLGLARAWRLKGQAHYLARRAGACVEASERALRHVRVAPDRYEERETIEWLVIALLLGPTRVDEARRRLDVLLAETGGDPLLHAEILAAKAGLVTLLQGPSHAEEFAAKSAAIMEEVGTHVWIVSFWHSFVYVAKRDPVAAERELRPAYEALKQLGEKSHFSSVSHGLGNALYHQGRLEEAEQMTRECEAACRPNDIHSHVLWRSTRAKVLARRGALAEAEALAREAVELAESSDFLIAHADALMDLAEVLELAGDADGATASADEGRRYFAAKGAAHAAWARGPRELDVADG